jgi:acetyl-CoA C-acetyltransferase
MLSPQRIYILGGYQSDFSRNWARDGQPLYDGFATTVQQGLQATGLDAADIQVGHVGNFVAPLFTGQAHLGGFFGHIDPALHYLPASSHEAACASGSMAMLAAMADISAGYYDLACVLGVEQMRNVAAEKSSENLRAAAWVGQEWQHTPYVWPCAFDNLLDEYDQRYGVNAEHLQAISKKNFANARNNPNAQTRNWTLDENSFSNDDEANPVISGRIRRYDCGQISDGAAVVFLASESRARQYAKSHNVDLQQIPYIKSFAHVGAPMLWQEKLRLSAGQDYIFPHLQGLFRQVLNDAGFESVASLDGLEVHDCFSITEYMLLDHSGWYPPGQAWQAIEAGDIESGGKLPINSSGGLLGLGHPVGATGVRMVLDAYKQSCGIAGDYQIEGANNLMTVNLGGSATTCASFIIGRD